MREGFTRNKLVETAIDLYISEVAVTERFAPIRATQISIWAETDYQCVICPSTVLYQLKQRSDRGELLRVVSHSPVFEYHFYLPLPEDPNAIQTT